MSDLSNLLELSNLTNLSVSDCPELTTDALIECVAGCKQLNTCAIKYCELIEERAAIFIINECRHLEGLQLLQGFDLLTVLEACERTAPETLRKLKWSGGIVCNVGMQMLASCAPLLTQLHLRNLANEFYDADVDYLVRNFPLLTDLALNSYQYISNTSMISIARNLSRVQKLSVYNCSNISDGGVILLAKHCQQLTLLSVGLCDKVTDESMREI